MSAVSDRHADAVQASDRSDLRTAFAAASRGHARSCLAPPAIAVALIRAGDWMAWRDDALRMLGASEIERVRRRRFATDRDALAIAYAMHRLLLGEMLGQDPGSVPLDRDENGRPQVAGGIVHTSLSHADGLIAVAVTTAGAVGVDIEPAARASVMAEIAHCVCHRSEAAAVAALAEPARSAALLALWVRKEAALKAAGVGLALPMELFPAPDNEPLLLPIADARALRVCMLEAGTDCVAAVAGPPGFGIDCRWLRPDHGLRSSPGVEPSGRGFDGPCRPLPGSRQAGRACG